MQMQYIQYAVFVWFFAFFVKGSLDNNLNKSKESNLSNPRPSHKRCGLQLLNGHNVGHLFADVFSAMLETDNPPCTFVFSTESALKAFWVQPIVKIAQQLQIQLKADLKHSFERDGKLGIDFYYNPNRGKFTTGFARIREIVQNHITKVCKCPEYPTSCNVTKVTVFNRAVRHYYNHVELLKRLKDMNVEWEYIDSTTNWDQCWHFCHYRNSSIVFTPYGAESIYPLLTNRSSIIMGYQGRIDNFIERVLGDYNFYGGNIFVVNASRSLEAYNQDCYNRWMNPPSQNEIYYYPKCMSYYLDQTFLDNAIDTVEKIRQNICAEKNTLNTIKV